jgi:hypothetical protein
MDSDLSGHGAIVGGVNDVGHASAKIRSPGSLHDAPHVAAPSVRDNLDASSDDIRHLRSVDLDVSIDVLKLEEGRLVCIPVKWGERAESPQPLPDALAEWNAEAESNLASMLQGSEPSNSVVPAGAEASLHGSEPTAPPGVEGNREAQDVELGAADLSSTAPEDDSLGSLGPPSGSLPSGALNSSSKAISASEPIGPRLSTLRQKSSMRILTLVKFRVAAEKVIANNRANMPEQPASASDKLMAVTLTLMEAEGKHMLFALAHSSLFVFPPNSAFRRSLMNLARNPWFDRTVLLLITVNSAMLAVFDPLCVGHNEYFDPQMCTAVNGTTGCTADDLDRFGCDGPFCAGWQSIRPGHTCSAFVNRSMELADIVFSVRCPLHRSLSARLPLSCRLYAQSCIAV